MATPAKTQNNPASQPSLDGASSVFAADLGQDENLLWQSRPGAGAYAIAHMRAVFMALTFFLVAIGWHAMAARVSSIPELGLASWLFAAMGGYYITFPAVAFMKAKWFIFYALTNQRLIILQLFPKHRIESFPLQALHRAVVHNVSLGHGTLLIDAPGAVPKNMARPRAGFYGVKYVAKVQEAIETLRDPEAALKRAQVQKAQMLKQAEPQGLSGMAPPADGSAPASPTLY